MKLRIDIKTATSLGLLINELITNALKHAFPDGRTGTISAGLEVRDGLVEVVISDDGVGLPKGFSPADSKGLGFQLASALAAQIGGTLEVAANDGAGGGTRIVVELPVPPPSRLPA
jgi:two-component sensor histidine kinase